MTAFELVNDADLELLASTLRTLASGYAHLPHAASQDIAPDQYRDVLQQVAKLMHDNYPYAHPLYAGQMLKPPHPIARIAYQSAMWINPNNHALDGGRASSAMEKTAVDNLATMFGFSESLGHLTSSGTLANLEALWVAREQRPGLPVASSAEAHYTHARVSAVLGMQHLSIPTDAQGRISVDALDALATTQEIGTVVATSGTTSFGAVDPIEQIVALSRRHGFRVHVDAAYGGYFAIASGLRRQTAADFAAISTADSVAIDPHKHGLQPYGCGCVLFSDPQVGRHYQHDSPYTYFTSDALHLGEISLECSRAGAAAVALWATQQALPMMRGGVFSNNLDLCIAAASDLYSRLLCSEDFTPVQSPDLDIVVWCVNAETGAQSSQLAQAVFDEAAKDDLHLALIKVDAQRVPEPMRNTSPDASVTCLRSCLMKPEHAQWLPEIYARLERATQRARAAL